MDLISLLVIFVVKKKNVMIKLKEPSSLYEDKLYIILYKLVKIFVYDKFALYE